MMKNALVIFLLIGGSLASFNSIAENLKITAPILGERLLTASGSGFWGELMDGALANVRQPYEFSPLPLKRSLSVFNAEDVDCLWGLNKTLLAGMDSDVSKGIESQSIVQSSQHIFTAPGLKPVLQWSELKDMKVGIAVGSNLEGRLKEASANVVMISSEAARLRMIINNRLDAFGGWMPDMLILARDERIDLTLFNQSIEVGSSGITFVCHPSENSEAFIEEINLGIDDYIRSEDFKALVYRYGAEAMYQGILR